MDVKVDLLGNRPVQIGEFVEERFGSACRVLLLDVYGTSVDEQLAVTTTASVFVSQTGTLTDSLAVFLKPGAVLIEIGQYEPALFPGWLATSAQDLAASTPGPN
jgi:hypothetical protein